MKSILLSTNLTEPLYSCPMHPEVTSTIQVKCPECGMYLELQSSAPYYCLIHQEETSANPGNCPVCGMKLEKALAISHATHCCCCTYS
jgi:hypothetical protein